MPYINNDLLSDALHAVQYDIILSGRFTDVAGSVECDEERGVA